jgi:chemotaxis response regulator CheB
MGFDDSEDAKSIKENGGRVLFQTPNSCENTSMPESAMETGCVTMNCSLEK